jgi:hypothetical protein
VLLHFGRALCVALVLSSIAGCAARDLDWEIRLTPPELAASTVRIDARILRGACPGTDEVWSGIVHPLARADEGRPDLDEGTYCFEVLVGDASCQWIARGTETVELPRDELLVVTAAAAAPTPSCTTTCEAGFCAGGGGGGSCLGGGCTFRCDDDCSASCEGGGCTMECLGTATCDFSCAGGGCNVSCAGTSDCTASCAAGSCDMDCTDVAGCDFSCAVGSCSFMCSTTDACETSCPLRNCTGP